MWQDVPYIIYANAAVRGYSLMYDDACERDRILNLIFFWTPRGILQDEFRNNASPSSHFKQSKCKMPCRLPAKSSWIARSSVGHACMSPIATASKTAS